MSIHVQLLGAVFTVAVVLGVIMNKTHFCAMGAVSDWVNIGDTGRMRAWVFSMAVALAGVVALEDVPKPVVEADDDVIIEVEACGICGSDLQILNVPPGHPADVGVVMGHEFGHHIQYELGLFDPVPSPEATRRTELMADSYAAYFGAHKRGLTLNTKRIVDALLSFYAVGDCAFDDNGHHGTPNQRERAATWGAQLAKAASPASSKLLASEFADLFEAKLPELVAPDA